MVKKILTPKELNKLTSELAGTVIIHLNNEKTVLLPVGYRIERTKQKRWASGSERYGINAVNLNNYQYVLLERIPESNPDYSDFKFGTDWTLSPAQLKEYLKTGNVL